MPVKQIQKGIRKNNIDTDLRRASTSVIQQFLQENTSKFLPHKYLKGSTHAMKEIGLQRYEAFAGTGQESKISVNILEAMYISYSAGPLWSPESANLAQHSLPDTVRKPQKKNVE